MTPKMKIRIVRYLNIKVEASFKPTNGIAINNKTIELARPAAKLAYTALE